jgi:hypothetical protein
MFGVPCPGDEQLPEEGARRFKGQEFALPAFIGQVPPAGDADDGKPEESNSEYAGFHADPLLVPET